MSKDKLRKVQKTDDQWHSELEPLQYEVTRHAATERAFSGQYWNHWEAGQYLCICCNTPLFSSEKKFDAGCGWPSYTQAIHDQLIDRVLDTSHGMVRIEVLCENCGAHLGHVFDDGPDSTGERFCINSAAINFVKPNPDASS
ncbi:MAG: peptide-methionine (R)-S-oxide reductase MsrB [Burkholderiales bacterium]|jgi:peptide-methionine (R)-S-oxide reductase